MKITGRMNVMQTRNDLAENRGDEATSKGTTFPRLYEMV
jgi:hypothetical protein